MLKKILAATLATMLTLSLAACGGGSTSTAPSGSTAPSTSQSSGAAEKEVKLTLANHLAPEATQSLAMNQLVEDLNGAGAGFSAVTSFSAQLGGQREIIEGVNLGTIEIGFGESGLYSNYYAPFGAMVLPFQFENTDHFYNVMDGDVGKQLADGLEANSNLHILCWYDGGARDIYSSKELTSDPSSLAGLKIRTPESPVYVSTFKALGANPTPIAANEMYFSIQSDVVSAMEGSQETAYTYTIYEVAKYCLESGHIWTDGSLVINKDLWASMSDNQQKVLQDAATASATFQRETANSKISEYKQKLSENGVQFIECDKAAAQAMCESVYTDFIGGDSEIQAIVDAIKAAK